VTSAGDRPFPLRSLVSPVSRSRSTIGRVQRAAFTAARVDGDPEPLAFAGALEPARRAADDADSVLASVTASLVAERLSSATTAGDRFGPAAARTVAGPVAADGDGSPLVVGAALLADRTSATAADAAEIAGVPVTIVERTRESLGE